MEFAEKKQALERLNDGFCEDDASLLKEKRPSSRLLARRARLKDEASKIIWELLNYCTEEEIVLNRSRVDDKVEAVIVAEVDNKVDDKVEAVIVTEVADEVDDKVEAVIVTEVADKVDDKVEAVIVAEVADEVADKVEAVIVAEVDNKVDNKSTKEPKAASQKKSKKKMSLKK